MAEAATIVRSMVACPLPLVARLEQALDDLLTAEAASFDEEPFRANLAAMRARQ